MIGFDHIRVYSNDCSDGTDMLLDKMQTAELIEHVSWPGVAGVSPQLSAYADALQACDTEWLMPLDVDEFLNLATHRTVGEFLATFPDDASGIAICWRIFGSGGQLWRGPQRVTDRFTWAAPVDHYLNRRIKSISRVGAVENINAHVSTPTKGVFVLPTGEPAKLHRESFARPRYEVAQINHYCVKSRAEYEEKRQRGCVNMPPEHPNRISFRPPTFFDEHDRNEERDRSILRHRDALGREMRKIEEALGVWADGTERKVG